MRTYKVTRYRLVERVEVIQGNSMDDVVEVITMTGGPYQEGIGFFDDGKWDVSDSDNVPEARWELLGEDNRYVPLELTDERHAYI